MAGDMSEVKRGDAVVVLGQAGRAAAGIPGVVVKVGRKLATIRAGGRDDTFRLDTRVINNPYARLRFETPEDADRILRDRAARSLLRRCGIELNFRFTYTLEQVEALAEVAATFTGKG